MEGVASVNKSFSILNMEKQAGILDKLGKPFILVQNNPIVKNSKSSKSSIFGDLKSYMQSKLVDKDRFLLDTRQAKRNIIDYINHPIVKETANRNDALASRMASYAENKLLNAPQDQVPILRKNLRP